MTVTSGVFSCTCCVTVVPQIALTSFACFVMVSDENILTARKAFVSLALFELLNSPLSMLPFVITDFIEVRCVCCVCVCVFVNVCVNVCVCLGNGVGVGVTGQLARVCRAEFTSGNVIYIYIYIDKNVFKTTRSFCYQWFHVSTLQANANRPFILSSMKRTTGGGHLENAFSRWPPPVVRFMLDNMNGLLAFA